TPVLTTGTPVSGAPLTFSATVTTVPPGGGTPTNTITFFDGANNLGTVAVNGSGIASITYAPPAGAHSITAVYNGDAHFLPSTSASVVTIVPSQNPGVVGQPETFTITVRSGGTGTAIPTGTVQLLDGATVLATLTLNNGQASFTSNALAAGSHAILANYSGDTNYAPASATYGLFAGKSAQTLTLTVNQAATAPGQPVTFTAQLTGQAAGIAAPT